MAKRSFSGQAEQDLCDEYRAGASTLALADKYGVERITVARTLRRNGLQIRGPQGHDAVSLSSEDVDEIVWRRKAGEKIVDIARSYGTHTQRISTILKQHGALKIRRGPAWKGGRVITAKGYVTVHAEDDPLALAMASTIGYVMEHRLVLARSLGRPLDVHESVHHINGDRQDNRLENLQLRNGKHGKGQLLRCRCCGSNDIEAVELD